MINATPIKRGSSSLLILFVVFVFVLCSLFMILYGAHVYTSIRDRVGTDFAHRMGISYITNKLRACDSHGGVIVENGNSALRLCAEPDSINPVYMYVYHYNGNIMEFVTQDIEDFNPSDGEIIIAADYFTITQITGGLSFEVGIGQENVSYTVSLKCI